MKAAKEEVGVENKGGLKDSKSYTEDLKQRTSTKASTLAQKKKEGKNKGILKRDGELSENWHVDFEKGKAIVTSNIQTKSGFKYGAVHQWGNKKKENATKSFFVY